MGLSDHVAIKRNDLLSLQNIHYISLIDYLDVNSVLMEEFLLRKTFTNLLIQQEIYQIQSSY